MLVRVSAVLLLAAATVCLATQYRDCGSTGVKIVSVDVNTCTDSEPVCVLYRGNNVTANITFTAKQDFDLLNNAVVGILNGVQVNFKLFEPSVCLHGVSCPIKAGQTVTDTLSSGISKTYPAVKITSMLKLIDKRNNMQGCMEVVFQLL